MIESMKHDQPQFKLRLPQALKESLEQEAANNDRTLTAEIVARLDGSYSPADSAQKKFLLARLQFDLAKQHAESELQASNHKIFAIQVAQFLELLGQSAWKPDGELQKLFGALEQKAREQISLPMADPESISSDLAIKHAQLKTALNEFLDARERPVVKPSPPNKIILVGNIGREPFERDISGYGPSALLMPKQAANKGPAPSANTRKRPPRNPKT